MAKRAKILDGSGDLHVGVDAMHVPLDPQGRAALEQRQADALAYLTRRFPPAEAAELADILGLAPAADARRAGYCDCGRELTLTSARARDSRCYYCTTGAAAPAPAGAARRKAYEQALDPVIPAGAAPYPDAEALCVDCGRIYRLPASGRLRPHPGWLRVNGVDVRQPTDCPGSGRRPGDEP